MYKWLGENTVALQSLTTSKYTMQLLQNLSYVMSKSLGNFTANVLSKQMPRKISFVSCFCPTKMGLI